MDKNKVNVPKIRFPGFTDPWEQRKLSEIADLTSSKRVHAENYVESGIPFYRGKEISELRQHKQVSEVLYITEEKYEKISKLYGSPKLGDLLITAVGTIGNTWVVDNVPFYFKDGNLIWFKNIKCNSKYLDFVLSSTYGQKKIMDSAIGSNQKALTMVKLNELHFMFPKEAEQEKLAEYFSNIDNLITLHQRKLNHLQDKKKSLLQKMFPKNGEDFPELRFPGFTDPWEQRKLGEVVHYIVDNRGKNPSYYCEEGIPVIDNYMIKNTLYPDLTIANRFINEDQFNNFIRKYNKVDDILITLVGNGIGNISLFPDSKAVIIQNTLGLRSSEHKKFLFFLLMAKNKDIVALDRGMAQPSIRQDEILDIDILIPQYKEQQKIGEYFSSLDHLITLHQRKLEHLQQQKKGLLQQMFI